MTVLNLVRVELTVVVNGEGLRARELRTDIGNKVKRRFNLLLFVFELALHLYRYAKVIKDEDPLVEVELLELEDRKELDQLEARKQNVRVGLLLIFEDLDKHRNEGRPDSPKDVVK